MCTVPEKKGSVNIDGYAEVRPVEYLGMKNAAIKSDVICNVQNMPTFKNVRATGKIHELQPFWIL